MTGARIIKRRRVLLNAGVSDALDIQREGFKRSEELRQSTGVSGKQIARENADHEFEIWWEYRGFEESSLPKAEAKKEWLKGFRGRGWGSHNPSSLEDQMRKRIRQRLAEGWSLEKIGDRTVWHMYGHLYRIKDGILYVKTARGDEAFGPAIGQSNPKASDPFERFLDLQKQGFMKRAKRKPITMYRAMTPHGATYTGPNKDIAESHVRQYGGEVETFRE